MELRNISISKPEGCQAALIEETSRIRGGFLSNDQLRTEIQIVCGARTNRVSDTQTLGALDGTFAVNPGRTELAKKATSLLTAMCLGCEYNTNTPEII